MISRHWRALAHHGEADNYISHLLHETFPKLSGIGGFIQASILRRETPKGTEFLIVTEWQSLDAIKSSGPTRGGGGQAVLSCTCRSQLPLHEHPPVSRALLARERHRCMGSGL